MANFIAIIPHGGKGCFFFNITFKNMQKKSVIIYFEGCLQGGGLLFIGKLERGLPSAGSVLNVCNSQG